MLMSQKNMIKKLNQEIKEDIPIEEVKRSVDSKRAKNETNKYSKESKLKNLELARERKKKLNSMKRKIYLIHMKKIH